MRESLFSILGSHGQPVAGGAVLDLFAGTGALGLEALSRGAGRATFVELGRAGQRLIAANIALLDLGDRAALRRGDATRLGEGVPHDLVLLDPPYGRALGERALVCALAGGWIAPDALIAWEEAAPPDVPAEFVVVDQRRYGDTVVTLVRLR